MGHVRPWLSSWVLRGTTVGLTRARAVVGHRGARRQRQGCSRAHVRVRSTERGPGFLGVGADAGNAGNRESARSPSGDGAVTVFCVPLVWFLFPHYWALNERCSADI